MSAPSSPRPGGGRWHQLTSQPRGPPAGLRSIVQPLADLGYMPRRRNKRRSKAREEEGKKEGGRRERVVEAWQPLMPGTHQPRTPAGSRRQLSSGCQAAKSWTEHVPGGRGAECGLVVSRPTVPPDVGTQEARASFTQKCTHLQLLQTLQRTRQSPFWRHGTKPPPPRAAPGTDHLHADQAQALGHQPLDVERQTTAGCTCDNCPKPC